MSFHPGDQNRRHLALDVTNTPVREELGSNQVAPGATFSKLLPPTKTICPGQVWVGSGLLIDRASELPNGRQT